MSLWLITDTHFNDTDLCEFEDRPPDFNNVIIENWNRLVREEDTIIHLGDVMVGDQSPLKWLIPSLAGHKVLVRGNHDTETMSFYLSTGFCFVCDLFSLDDVVFSHKPLKTFPDGARLNVHGHFHRRGQSLDEYLGFFQHRNKNCYLTFHIEGSLSPVLLSDVLDG